MVPPDEGHHLAGAVAGGVDDVLAVDGVGVAVLGARGDGPVLIRMLRQADDALEAADAGTQRASGAGHRLRDL